MATSSNARAGRRPRATTPRSCGRRSRRCSNRCRAPSPASASAVAGPLRGAGPAGEAGGGGPPPFPRDLLARAGTQLGRALASVAALVDLEAVAVGGGVAEGAGGLLLDPARAELARSFRIFGRPLEVVPTSAGPLVGAAAVFLSRHGGV